MKLASTDIPLFQAIFLRGIFATSLMALLCWRLGAFRNIRSLGPMLIHPMMILRTLGEIGGTFFFISALFNMPIANVTAVLQGLPLLITLSAALFLGEKVGWRRYVAIVVGLAGVLLIIRPGTDAFNGYAVYAVVATLFITLRDLATRRMPDAIPSVLISVVTSCAVTLMGLSGSLFISWNPVGLPQAALLMAAAIVLMGAYLCSILAMRNGDVGFVSPFRYSILLWALLLGVTIFGEIPDGLALVGAAIVVGSGLFNFYRERLIARRASRTG